MALFLFCFVDLYAFFVPWGSALLFSSLLFSSLLFSSLLFSSLLFSSLLFSSLLFSSLLFSSLLFSSLLFSSLLFSSLLFSSLLFSSLLFSSLLFSSLLSLLFSSLLFLFSSLFFSSLFFSSLLFSSFLFSPLLFVCFILLCVALLSSSSSFAQPPKLTDSDLWEGCFITSTSRLLLPVQSILSREDRFPSVTLQQQHPLVFDLGELVSSDWESKPANKQRQHDRAPGKKERRKEGITKRSQSRDIKTARDSLLSFSDSSTLTTSTWIQTRIIITTTMKEMNRLFCCCFSTITYQFTEIKDENNHSIDEENEPISVLITFPRGEEDMGLFFF